MHDGTGVELDEVTMARGGTDQRLDLGDWNANGNANDVIYGTQHIKEMM